MVKVFVSYAREDQAVVEPIVRGLEDAGITVWWDKDLASGEAFRSVIEQQLQSADVILVIWSKRSKQSRWVIDEAEHGVRRGLLIPVKIDSAGLPLGFGGFNALDFSTWGGDFNSAVWRRLLNDVDRIAGAPLQAGVRPAIRIVPRALTVAGGVALVAGVILWFLYAVASGNGGLASTLGHPLVDAVVLAFMICTPVVLWSAWEVKRAGFESTTLIARRALVWFLRGGSFALLIIAAAVAGGAVEASAPRAVILELLQIFSGATIVSACAMAIIGWVGFMLRPLLGSARW